MSKGVSCGCETCVSHPKGIRRLRMIEKRALRKIYQPERRRMEKLHN
jgi:hypothetical protein